MQKVASAVCTIPSHHASIRTLSRASKAVDRAVGCNPQYMSVSPTGRIMLPSNSIDTQIGARSRCLRIIETLSLSVRKVSTIVFLLTSDNNDTAGVKNKSAAVRERVLYSLRIGILELAASREATAKSRDLDLGKIF